LLKTYTLSFELLTRNKGNGAKTQNDVSLVQQVQERALAAASFLLPQKHYRGNEIESVAIDSGTLSADEIGTDVTGQPDIIIERSHGVNLAVQRPTPPAGCLLWR